MEDQLATPIMRLTRIFCDSPMSTGLTLDLPAAAAHHVARVLRLRAGAALSLFDGAGQEFHAEIVRIASSSVSVLLGLQAPPRCESPLEITLIQGISRGERMDWTLQKATELGVHAIAPVLTARSVVQLDAKQAEKKRGHWRGVVIGACEQCGRARVPSIATPLALPEHLRRVHEGGLRLVLNPAASASLAGLANLPTKVAVLVGPEGGLEDEELASAETAGFMPVRLGPRVLRTETAAVVALSVLQALWGDLR
jgi:16S rRNA (uracil1498-N3)-methyltransferase